MTEINQFSRGTSLALIELLRSQRRTKQFEEGDSRISDLNDFAFFFKTPPEGIPARIEGDPPREDGICGYATCTRYLLLDNGEFEETDAEETVWNSEESEDIPGSTIVRVYVVCDKLVADTTDSIIKFRAKTAIAGRRFTASGIQGRYGDFDMFDPHNMWTTVTPGCIGTAYRGLTGKLEIHTCSLPANEIMVILKETLLSSMSGSEAVVDDNFYLRSTYPNVMKPPEIGTCSGFCTYQYNRSTETWSLSSACASGCECAPAPTGKPKNESDDYRYYPCTTTGEQTIEFTNPWKLDGMCSSRAVLRRVTNAEWGDTVGITDWETVDPITGSATQVRWEIVHVAKRKARWIQFPYSSEDPPDLEDYWDGNHPQQCDTTDPPVDCEDCDEDIVVEYPLGEPCEDDMVIARYNPERDTYIALDTRSSMLGMPVIRSFVNNIANHDCGITMHRTPVQVFMTKDEEGDCSAVSSPTDVTLGTTIPIMLEANSDECGRITYLQQFARVFLCDGDIVPNSFAINFDGVQFVRNATFGPQTCTGNATYTFNTGTNEWDLTTPCASGCESTPPAIPYPLPTGSITENVPCESPVNGQCGLNLELASICEAVPECGNVIYEYVYSGGGYSWEEVVSCPFGCTHEAPTFPFSPAEGDTVTVPCTPIPANVVHVPLPLVPVEVLTDVRLEDTELLFYRKSVYVCNWDAENDLSIEAGPCDTDSSGA